MEKQPYNSITLRITPSKKKKKRKKEGKKKEAMDEAIVGEETSCGTAIITIFGSRVLGNSIIIRARCSPRIYIRLG